MPDYVLRVQFVGGSVIDIGIESIEKGMETINHWIELMQGMPKGGWYLGALKNIPGSAFRFDLVVYMAVDRRVPKSQSITDKMAEKQIKFMDEMMKKEKWQEGDNEE